MIPTELLDDPEDTQHSAAERATAASRSTWVSVGVNVVLTAVQITVGVFANQRAHVCLLGTAQGVQTLTY